MNVSTSVLELNIVHALLLEKVLPIPSVPIPKVPGKVSAGLEQSNRLSVGECRDWLSVDQSTEVGEQGPVRHGLSRESFSG